MVNIDPDPAALGINTAARYGEMFASGEVNSQLFCQPGWCRRTHHLFYSLQKSLAPLPHTEGDALNLPPPSFQLTWTGALCPQCPHIPRGWT